MDARLGFRKLKEQQSKKKIDHPLAKYNNLGQITCIVCNLPLKNELLWQPHLLSKKHKEVVSSLRSKASEPKGSVKKSVSLKEDDYAPPSKRTRKEVAYTAPEAKLKNQGPSLVEGAVEPTKGSQINQKDAVRNSLPADFFDEKSSSVEIPPDKSIVKPDEQHGASESDSMSSKSRSISEKLPEGFFDDAKMDAKVRKVEYVDKKEEEWDQFQKMIAEETKVSENIQADEEEELKIERDLTEYGTLKQYLTRVERLKQKRNAQKNVPSNHKDQTEDIDNVDSGDSEDELEDILNWRAKKA